MPAMINASPISRRKADAAAATSRITTSGLADAQANPKKVLWSRPGHVATRDPPTSIRRVASAEESLSRYVPSRASTDSRDSTTIACA
jgi:hypothetical protein